MIAKTLITFLIAACVSPTPAVKCNISSPAEPEHNSKLYRTSDLYIGEGEANLQFVNGQAGWLANRKRLWRTSDGGTTWELIYTGEVSWDTSNRIQNLQFVDSQTGWMSDAVKGIYKTADGGRTWAMVSNPFHDGAIYSIRFFKDGRQGWAAGIVNRRPPIKYKGRTLRDDAYAAISHTTDGGNTWRRQVITDTRGILELYFPDEERGWARGWPGLFYLDVKTFEWKRTRFNNGACTDGRTPDTRKLNSATYSDPAAICFLDQDQGWVAFNNGYMLMTTDQGRTWCGIFDPRDLWPEPVGQPYFWNIHFTDSMSGWAIGYNALYKTTDGGRTWAIAKTGDFKSLYFLDDHKGWAVAKDGVYSISS